MEKKHVKCSNVLFFIVWVFVELNNNANPFMLGVVNATTVFVILTAPTLNIITISII